MQSRDVVLALALFGSAAAQQAGTIVAEIHPPLSLSTCDATGKCTSEAKSVTVDSNWRWLEQEGSNCFTGNLWDNQTCPLTAEGATGCAAACSLEGLTTRPRTASPPTATRP